ncbi:uncharacterized protein LOC111903843 isoform X2 [Lactuca sativa]|uniref:uncharacterized protein LOC111903843 isoform X2 n=1 Tax=Lactuca sativa TaxID=4236 RepID=UPI0022AF0E82|nr:uncharacterized protein LOC111903843 isoform X2 [Lactuca sativa]
MVYLSACMCHWSAIRTPTVATAGPPKETANSRVLILGGTGRVGGSTAIALSKLSPDLRITIAGRNSEKGASMVATLGKNAKFSQFDINDDKSLESALTGVDLVVHAAGPFQQTQNCKVLESAIQAKTAYIDVCDDTNYALRAKAYKNEALAAKVSAITTCGMYPGVSNVLAAELVRIAKCKNNEPEQLRFYYYTAGTGGVGPSLLASSILVLGEEAITYSKGNKIKYRSYSGMVNINFGKGIGKKDVYLLNLPKVTSTHESLGVPSVSARFGTEPFLWNWALDVIACFIPSVDLECVGGEHMVSVFSHKNYSISIGTSIDAFALTVLEGSTQHGIWFPEEPEGIAIEARKLLLERAAQGTINFTINK